MDDLEEPTHLAVERAASLNALASKDGHRWGEDWHIEHAANLRTGDYDAELERIRAQVDEAATAALRTIYRDYRSDLNAAYIDWQQFWDRDRSDRDWLLDDVLARGRGHAIYAPQKQGKSELALWCVLEVLKQPATVVLYLDYEMSEEDVYDRLTDFGYGPDSNLDRLRYMLLPALPPLDTAEGGAILLARIDAIADEFPGHHIAVIIDTTGRALAGEENSADTIRGFYRFTGIGLKQRGVTWARLDHAGKDADRGQRGSSAKGDDVDIVWRVVRTDNGTELRRQAARPSWVPERVKFQRLTDPHLRYVRVAAMRPAGTEEAAELLDRLGVPIDAGERPARKALLDAGHNPRREIVRAAVRWRREAAEEHR